MRIFLEHQTAVALDDGQQVIEIVCNSRGQLSDRFHTLGLSKSSLKMFLFGHVDQNAM